MNISQVHPLDLATVFAPKHWTSLPKRVFRLRLRLTMQPTTKRKV
jgi:hypothetical protein